MASGTLASAFITEADAWTVIYTCPASVIATANVSVANSNTEAVNIKLAIANGTTPGNADLIEANTNLIAGGVLERTAVVLSAGDKIFAQANVANKITVRVWGFENAAS